MNTVCEINKCAGCMACVDICPKAAIEVKDDLSAYNALIREDRCVKCGLCHCVCQSNHPFGMMSPIKWYQGWSEDNKMRKKCSSGGFATAISTAFIESGGIVCACAFRKGKFVFEFAESIDDLQKFIGSKYVKSNPVGIYTKIKNILKKEQRVLFVGLPCQVSSLRNFVGSRLDANLYTVDLICHGTPSPQLLEIFLNQYSYSLSDIKDIQFRVKAKFQVYGDYKSIITNGVSDRYSIAFLNSLVYTENCYSCTYARKERVSDLTLGDSWGSKLPVEEQKKGISLALCQTIKGIELLEMAKLHLDTVNIDDAVANNHQLEHPSAMPKGRNKFFKNIKKRKFDSLVFWQLPKQCLRQNMKEFLIKTRIIPGGG